MIARALAAAHATGDRALEAEVRFQRGTWLRSSSRFEEAIAVQQGVAETAQAQRTSCDTSTGSCCRLSAN